MQFTLEHRQHLQPPQRPALELESQSEDGPALVHVVDKVVSVVIHIQNAVAAYERHSWTDVVAKTTKGLPGKLRATTAKIKVTQRRSVIDRPKDQKDTVRRLGLHRINDSVVKDDRPEIRGMINKVRHLVDVEEVTGE